jgi:sugar O-acyltransferase (sialic acid O-acetyltransferase NeuD family)
MKIIKKKLVIVGAGGAASEAVWVARRASTVGQADYEILGFCDDNPTRIGEAFDGLEVLGTSAQIARNLAGRAVHFHCAIGSNRARQRLVALFEEAGLIPEALVDPSAIVAPSASVGAGTFIGPLSIVAPHARIGRHVLINTHVGVGHHAIIEDFVQLCPGVRVSGGCKVDTGAFLGSNAVVHPGLTIGEGAVIGASSFVIRSVKPRFSMMGVPARIVSRPAENGPDAQT